MRKVMQTFIPEGYHTATPYLLVQGAEKLINFMKKPLMLKKLGGIQCLMVL